jgi:hypothetical protein
MSDIVLAKEYSSSSSKSPSPASKNSIKIDHMMIKPSGKRASFIG